MGYYTGYTLYAYKDGGLTNKEEEKIIEELHQRDIFLDSGDLTYGLFYEGKCWLEDEVKTVSKLFPDVIFEMYGDGDDSEDFWKGYYLNGAETICRGTIVYEECDLSRAVDRIMHERLSSYKKIKDDPKEEATEINDSDWASVINN